MARAISSPDDDIVCVKYTPSQPIDIPNSYSYSSVDFLKNKTNAERAELQFKDDKENSEVFGLVGASYSSSSSSDGDLVCLDANGASNVSSCNNNDHSVTLDSHCSRLNRSTSVAGGLNLLADVTVSVAKHGDDTATMLEEVDKALVEVVEKMNVEKEPPINTKRDKSEKKSLFGSPPAYQEKAVACVCPMKSAGIMMKVDNSVKSKPMSERFKPYYDTFVPSPKDMQIVTYWKRKAFEMDNTTRKKRIIQQYHRMKYEIDKFKEVASEELFQTQYVDCTFMSKVLGISTADVAEMLMGTDRVTDVNGIIINFVNYYLSKI